MRIAITGGTGFVGGHLARTLAAEGHDVILIARDVDRRDDSIRSVRNVAFARASVADEEALVEAFAGCEAVAHCAGINRELGAQTYRSVHVEGTHAVISAAKRAGAKKVVLLSYLRARPGAGSGYLESKWAAEEVVRSSGLDYAIVKAGVIFGRGDHLIDHTARSLGMFHLFASVGLRDRRFRPVAVQDVVRILREGLAGTRLDDRTVSVLGPEEMPFKEVARRIARAMGVRALILPGPMWFLRLLALLSEWSMTIPLVSRAQVRLLAEASVLLPGAEEPPDDLRPETHLASDVIRLALPDPARFRLEDLRWFRKRV